MFICNLAPRKRGAFEDFVIGVGEGLSERGDELVCLFSETPCSDVAKGLDACGARWHTAEGWADEGAVHPWAVVRPAMRVLRQEVPDVVAVHFGNELPSIALIAASRLSTRHRASWVWHQRQQISDPGIAARRISRIRAAASFFDHMVVSYKGALRSMTLRGVNENAVSVIYNSLRHGEEAPTPYVRRELSIPADAVVVANVGWLVPRKRTHLSVQAFAYAKERNDCQVHLLLVGDGPEESTLRKLVGELGLQNRVHFLGMRDDVRNILAEADVLIHSSAAETCTNVVQEAMAASCTTVMMEAGAAREQVEDGVTGFVVGRDDVSALQERLAEIANDDAKRAAMGQAAHERWLSVFRLATSVEKHCALYRSLAAGAVERQFPG